LGVNDHTASKALTTQEVEKEHRLTNSKIWHDGKQKKILSGQLP